MGSAEGLPGDGRLESARMNRVPPPRRRRRVSSSRRLREAGAGADASTGPPGKPSPSRRRTTLGVLPEKMPGGEADTPALVSLGRALYFEKRLSVNGTQSCNDCHRLDGERPVRRRREDDVHRGDGEQGDAERSEREERRLPRRAVLGRPGEDARGAGAGADPEPRRDGHAEPGRGRGRPARRAGVPRAVRRGLPRRGRADHASATPRARSPPSSGRFGRATASTTS